MREIRTSGSEGGGAGNSTGSPYPYKSSTLFKPHERSLSKDLFGLDARKQIVYGWRGDSDLR